MRLATTFLHALSTTPAPSTPRCSCASCIRGWWASACGTRIWRSASAAVTSGLRSNHEIASRGWEGYPGSLLGSALALATAQFACCVAARRRRARRAPGVRGCVRDRRAAIAGAHPAGAEPAARLAGRVARRRLRRPRRAGTGDHTDRGRRLPRLTGRAVRPALSPGRRGVSLPASPSDTILRGTSQLRRLREALDMRTRIRNSLPCKRVTAWRYRTAAIRGACAILPAVAGDAPNDEAETVGLLRLGCATAAVV